MTKVSVIIPIYNKARELPECLDSVCAQTLQDIEIICIDDGSTDWAWAVLEFYQQRDSRLKLYKQNNLGVAVARNRGLRLATGEFVAFMDPDDCYSSVKSLKSLYDAALRLGVRIVGGGVEEWHSSGEIKLGLASQVPGVYVYQERPFDYWFWRFLYKRSFLIKNNIFFPNYRRYQDPVFLVRAMMAAGKYGLISEVVYRYRFAPVLKRVCWNADTWARLRAVCVGMRHVIMLAKQFHLEQLIKEEVGHLVGRPGSVFNEILVDGQFFEFQEFKSLLKELPHDEAKRVTDKIRMAQLTLRKTIERNKRRNDQTKGGDMKTAKQKIRALLKYWIPYGIMKAFLRRRYNVQIP